MVGMRNCIMSKKRKKMRTRKRKMKTKEERKLIKKKC